MRNEKHRQQVNDYIRENYVQFAFKLRTDEDADLIKAIQEETIEGNMTKREWMRNLYYSAPKLPEDLCSISEVERLLMMYRIPRVTRINIIQYLKAQTE